jgi:hypothetical protein
MASFFGTKKEPIGQKTDPKSVYPFDGQRDVLVRPRWGTGRCGRSLLCGYMHGHQQTGPPPYPHLNQALGLVSTPVYAANRIRVLPLLRPVV